LSKSADVLRLALLAAATALIGAWWPAFADDSNQAAVTFSNVKPSLAFVVAHADKKTASLGTAFCIGTYNGYAAFLTNRHVVGDDEFPKLFLMADQRVYKGFVVRQNASIDVAIIAVPLAPSVSPLTLAKALPSDGQGIAIAGFPAIQVQLFVDNQGLSPSVHLGVISAVVSGGDLLEYDAQTDHGNSGGPLFDVQTGDVYGVVTMVNTGVTGALQNNFAIAAPAIT
jgi:S1-C subfamily serine protease